MTKTKVLFVCPPYSAFSPKEATIPPLGVARIAANIRNHADIRIIDMGSKEALGLDSWRILIDELESYEPDVAAIGPLVTSNIGKGEKIAQIVKSVLPSCKTAIGGPDPTFTYNSILKRTEEVDIIFIGESETSFSKFIHLIHEQQNWERINGVSFGTKNGICSIPSQMLTNKKFESLPFPAWDLFPLDDYAKISANFGITPYLPVESSRGCPLDCLFCACSNLFERKVNLRSAVSIADELQMGVERYNYNRFVFNDDNFTHSNKHVYEICEEIIKRKLNKVQYACSSTVESRIFDDRSLIKLMKDAGFTEIFMGCETIHADIIAGIGKTFKCNNWKDKIRKAINICKNNDIASRTNWILGLPFDTRDKFIQTMDFIKATKPDSALLSLLQPYPGTRLALMIDTEPEKVGIYRITDNPSMIVASKFDPVLYSKWMSREDIIELSYKFVNQLNTFCEANISGSPYYIYELWRERNK